ncbi:Microsomal glutathione S-transferase 3 [Allomyces javanicus]|nr:Microsomal glutathione S-transferase 3 [Allomyces javanicus]
MSAAITLASDFGYVVLSLVALNLHYSTSSRYVMALRKKYGIQYPDMGNGRYSAKLTDAQWHEFNSAQRVHQNYLEQLPTVNTMVLLSGLFNPTWTAGLTGAYIIGRQIYIHGYIHSGPQARLRGSALFWPAFFGLVGIAAHGAIKLLGYL